MELSVSDYKSDFIPALASQFSLQLIAFTGTWIILDLITQLTPALATNYGKTGRGGGPGYLVSTSILQQTFF